MGVLLLGLVCVGMLALGVRLLRLSQRSGAWPEYWLGLAFAIVGGSAWLIPLAATEGLAGETARAIALVAQAALSVAISLLALFTANVFHPTSAARWLAPLLVAANLAAWPR